MLIFGKSNHNPNFYVNSIEWIDCRQSIKSQPSLFSKSYNYLIKLSFFWIIYTQKYYENWIIWFWYFSILQVSTFNHLTNHCFWTLIQEIWVLKYFMHKCSGFCLSCSLTTPRIWPSTPRFLLFTPLTFLLSLEYIIHHIFGLVSFEALH